MQSNEKNVDVIKFDFRKLPEYNGAKERQEKLVKENPFIEVADNETYNEARRRRTALRQGRYELQNGQKVITQKLNDFKKEVQEETIRLIEITKPHEEEQQQEIEKYEEKKRAEKEEREKQERERIENIKGSISEYRESMAREIKNMTLNNAEKVKEDLDNIQMDCEEFQQDFDLIRENFYEQYHDKKASLDEAERIRVENEKIKEDQKRLEDERKKMEAEKISMRTAQLKEIGLSGDENGNYSINILDSPGLTVSANQLKSLSLEDFNETVSQIRDEIKRLKEVEAQKEKEKEEKKEKIAKQKAENDRRIDMAEKLGFAYDFEKDNFNYNSVSVPGSLVLVPHGGDADPAEYDNDIYPVLQAKISEETRRIEKLKPEKQRIIEALDGIKLPELELEQLSEQYAEIKGDLYDMIEIDKDYINNL